MKRPLVSDWHTAPEAERQKVRRLLFAVVVLMAIDGLLLWSMA